MSLYQLACAIEGWNRANGAEAELTPLTVEEYERDMLAAAVRTGPVN